MSSSRRQPHLEYYNVHCTRETHEALLIADLSPTGPIWIPKSQIRDDSDVTSDGDAGTLVITAWIAKQKDIDDFGEQT